MSAGLGLGGRVRRRLGWGEHSTSAAVAELARSLWRASPGFALAAVGDAVLRGVARPLQVLAMGGVVAALTGGGVSLSLAVGALVALGAVQTIGPHLTEPFVKELSRRVDLGFRHRAMTAISRPDGIGHLEDAGVQDLISTAQGIANPWSTPGGAVVGYLNLINNKVAALGSVVLLSQYRWWLAVLVLAGSLLVRRRILAVWFRLGEALRGDVPGLRRAAYFRDLAVKPETAKEGRIFGLGAWLIERHEAVWSEAMAAVWDRRRRIGWQMPAVVGAVLVLAGVTAAPIAAGLVAGDITAAEAVVLGGALAAIIGLGGFLPEADFPIRYGAVAVPALLDLERRLAPAAAARAKPESPPLRDAVVFSGVAFRYPTSPDPVLDGLDFAIPAGTNVALVGSNGAGKTTIIKLLARLYEPTGGVILVDGHDIAGYDAAAWRRQLGVIFQDFARYELPARDNVGFGALHLLEDPDAIEAAADRAGILSAVRGLPLGWDSPLARSYAGGADLSGGQWQRVALARALLAVRGGARILVLDEPTASLDVRAEANFYDRFIDLTAGVTTILVSHRFSTVRRADRICVVEDGRITEDGSHDDLLALDGTYARMFNLQAMRFAHD